MGNGGTNICLTDGDSYKQSPMSLRSMAQREAESGELRDDDTEFATVGRSEYRVDALGKVTGRLDYTADIDFEGLAHGRLVRSSIPHGRIESIDTSEAMAMDDVIAVVLASDIPGEPTIGVITPDQPLLNAEKVRCVGDPLAIVVAETERAARRGADRVDVEYDRLPHALTPTAAQAPDAAPIHPSGNVLDEYEYERGHPDEAFEEASVIVEETFESSMIDHVPIEPEAAVAHRTFDNGIEVWASTQHPHGDRDAIARVLGIRQRDVEVTRPAVGGGFGSKIEYHQPCYAALAAWVTDRPVRIKYTRDEEFRGTVKRNTLSLDYRVAADEDGALLGFDVDITVDGGAYASFSSAVAVRALVHCTGPYHVDTVRARGRAVYTNKPWGGAMRSFDMFQTTFAIESAVDLVAEELAMDPIEIRRVNAFDGSRPAPTTGQEIDDVGFVDTLAAVEDALGAREITQSEDPAKRRGVGIAGMWYGCGKTGHHHPSSAYCEIHADGTVTVQSAVSEIGQGSDTALTQIAAETLGLPMEDVRLITDSTVAPEAGKTSASRQTFVSGNAIRRAVEDALTTMFDHATQGFEAKFDVPVAPAELEAQNEMVVHRPTGNAVSFSEIARTCINDGILLTGTGVYTPLFDFDLSTFEGKPYPTFAFATHAAVVEVDIETGVISVEDLIASHDVGQAINPALVEGQIEGGAIMGMGHTIMEEVQLDGQGQILNASLMDYHVPTSLHAPKVDVSLVESAPDTDGPFGAKGVGECALQPVGAAVANAVRDAIGVQLTTLPLAPEQVIGQLPDDLSTI